MRALTTELSRLNGTRDKKLAVEVRALAKIYFMNHLISKITYDSIIKQIVEIEKE